ncbi:phosphoglucose isomerase [Campylobacter blaseri]|uniref:Glucose-6-phosphate isomerase n=1 Tax=Campylobacter blaseri TaxID=2042961 RepID=A0A2P8QZ35_9BACT|nr:glucose-6-phosphate isomerase [Campylobacter blaseri]PSM51508.1 glucose-6-phosphate isomerase [Campylobacter blaseri]PSM52957.1 glucose-6-phosphate isomerase [Campylobacter blaseri]QKF86481.1 phosphoglucose isomerase [Campylobacter blaseri]
MVTNNLKFSEVDIGSIEAYSKRINKEFEDGKIGYFHLPKADNKRDFERVDNFTKDKNFKYLVVIGMGGSSLGTKAVCKLLSDNKDSKKVYFLDNLDVSSIDFILNLVVFEKTLFFIVSKSGTTIETTTIFKYIIKKFDIKDFSKNFLFITDKNSALEKFGKENSVEIFNIPDNVGGRFSVLSSASLIPLKIAGFNVEKLLKGAKHCSDEFFIKGDKRILQKAYHYATHKKANINVLFSYSDKFDHFNEWYVQLWAESIGKKRKYKRFGLTPIGIIGSKDQHSFLQLIMDGVKDKTVTFIKVVESKDDSSLNLSLKYLESSDFTNCLCISEILNYQCDATMQAVLNEGISVDLITIDILDEWHVGYLMYYYMLLTSIVGVMFGINTYDQPGVEIGKTILKTIIKKDRI